MKYFNLRNCLGKITCNSPGSEDPGRKNRTMKHILPNLALAFLGAAATASAAETYDPIFEDIYQYGEKYGYYETPTVTTSNNKFQTIDYGIYSVIKEADRQLWTPQLNYNSYFKIHANEDIDFYLYDYVNNTGSSTNNNGLLNQNIARIGYRTYKLDTTTGEYVKKEEKTFDLKAISQEVFNVEFAGQTVEITRNSYSLGSFLKDEEFEIFMSYNADDSNGVWSNSGDSLPGGYSLYVDGENGYTNESMSPNVDKLMWAYKNDSYSSAMYGETPDENPLKQIKDDEAANAMPLASLDPIGGNRATFGLYATPAVHGSPLPGGLPIVLIAGLFGLGFWYIRRRKASVA